MSDFEESNVSNDVSADDRNLALLAHLLGIFTSVVGALVIWLIHKDKPEKAYVNENAKEALNFQITVLLALMVAGALVFIVIGLLLVSLVAVANIVFCILAAIAVSNGKDYRYPVALRLIK